jgi:hypothetical protein
MASPRLLIPQLGAGGRAECTVTSEKWTEEILLLQYL